MFFPPEVWDALFSFFPPVASKLHVLSTRRNKGTLNTDGKKFVWRTVNLSFLNSGLNDGYSSLVLRECAILRGPLAHHPNIVSLESVQFSLEEIRMTFPWYPFSLREVMNASLSVPEIAHQLFRGLAFVHSNGIAHRNIRPENILISKIVSGKFTLVITDFSSASLGKGPSTPCEQRNRMQTVKERARLVYRSPESLLRLATCGAATDVWAAGVVIAECLLGNEKLPWAGASSETELLMKIWNSVSSTPGPDLDLAIHFLVPVLHSRGSDEWMNATGAGQFLRRVFDLDPSTRMSASAALGSSFVLGNSANDPLIEQSRKRFVMAANDIGKAPKISSKWIIWLVQIALMNFEAPSSLSVHKAVRMVREARPSMLLAAFKICLRLETSRDNFKQTQCVELSSLTGIQHIVEAEVDLLNLDVLSEWTDINTSVEIVNLHCDNKMVAKLAYYVCDLCLIDEVLSQFNPAVIAMAALILASQWLDASFEEFAVPLDDVQLVLTRCVSLVKFSNHPFTSWYSLPPLGNIQTSRSYLSALLQRPMDQTPRRNATPAQAATHTPLFRTSTLQQASAWAQASRRRSRSAKRRRVSSVGAVVRTPFKPTEESEHHLPEASIDEMPFSSDVNKENHGQNSNNILHQELRRSVRLKNLKLG